MSDISVKVDILPIIEPDAIQKAVTAASQGIKLNITDANLAKGVIQEALNTASTGLKLDVGNVQFTNTANMGKSLAAGIQDQFSRSQKKSKIIPELDYRSIQNGMKKTVSSLTPLESKLNRLVRNGLDTAQAEKFRGSLAKVTGDIKKLSSATGQEFKRMQSSINGEMQKLADGMAKSEQKLQKQIIRDNMRTVNSRYNSLTGKMDKTGVSGRRAELDVSYQNARTAVEKATAAKFSGDASKIATTGAAAKKAVENFHTLSRSIDDAFSHYSRLQGVLSKLETQKSLLGSDPNTDSKKVAELDQELTKLRSTLSQMRTASGGEFEKLRADADKAAMSAGKMSDNLKSGLKDITTDMRPVLKMLEQIQKFEMNNPTLAGSTTGSRLASLKKELEEIVMLGQTTKTRNKELDTELKKTMMYAGSEGFSAPGGQKSTSTIASLFKNVTGSMIIYEIFNKAKQAARAMYDSVLSVDTAMTQLKIVTGASGSEMNNFFKEAAASATELGHSVSEVLGSIETFSRLGYNLKDAMSLSNAATVMSNVAAVGVDQSTTGITSIIKGFGIDPNSSMEIADKLTAVGQDYAVSAGELMEALQRSGSSLNSANNTIDESIALIAAGNASVQDAASVGTTLKTVAARVRGSEAVFDKDATDFEGLAESVSKYRKEIMALSGVDIMSDADSYKSTYQIFLEIAHVWDQMSDISQAALAERLGGKRNMNVVMSIIQNLKDLEGAYNDSVNAAGTAQEANDIYMDSIAGKIGQFKAQWDVFSNTTMDSEMVKPFISGATQLLSILTQLTGALRHLGPIIPLAGIYGASKGIGALARDLQDLKGVIGVISRKLVTFSDKTKASIGSWIKNNPEKIAAGITIAAGVAAATQIAYLNSYEKKYNDFKKSLEESKSLTAEASAMDETIKSNNSRIQALENIKNSASGLSAVDETELNLLKSQTAELERQRDIKENLAKVAQQTTSENAIDTLEARTGMFDYIKHAWDGDLKEYRTNLFQGLTPTEGLKNNVGFLKEQIKKREELEKKLGNMDPNQKGYDYQKEYKNYQKELDNTDKKITEARSNLSDNIAAVGELVNSIDRDSPEGKQIADQAEKALSDASRFLNESLGESIYDTIGKAVNSGALAEAGKKLQVMASTGSLTEEQVEKFRASSSELDSYMRTSGASAKEISEYFTDAAKSTDRLADNGLTSGLVLSAYSEEIQTLETQLGELSQLQSKLDSGEITMSDIVKLTDQFPELANNIDTANGKFTGLTNNIAEAKKETIDGFVETLEDLKKNAGSKAQAAVFDDLIKYVRNLGDAAKETSNLYGGMGAVIEDANNRAQATAAIVNQSESNAAYSTDVSAIKKMKEYREAGMTGLGNTKYWQIASELFDGGYDNVTIENVEKKRKQLNKQYEKWYRAFDDVDSDGKLTHAGAKSFLEIISDDEKVVDRMNALGDSIKQTEDGNWEINVDYSHLKILAKEAGLTEDALRDLFVQVSMFGDLDWNKDGPANALSVLDPNSWEYKSGKVNLSYDEAKSAASKLGMSVTDYTNKVSEIWGREVKLVDENDKEISKEQQEHDSKIMGSSDRHQGRMSTSESSDEKETANKKEEESVGNLINAYNQYDKVQDEIKEKGIDTSKTVFGNIDTNNRQVLKWTEDTVKQYQDALKSWGENPQDLIGSYSTIFGSSSEYGGVEIAFSPMLQTDKGAVLLSRSTMDSYFNELVSGLQSKGNWSTEDLLKLDSEGIIVDGQKIKNMVADVGDTAVKTGEAMHYIGKDGALSDATKNLKKAAKNASDAQGKINISESKMPSKEELNGHSAKEFTSEIEKTTDTEVKISVDADTSKADEAVNDTKKKAEESPPKINLMADGQNIEKTLNDAMYKAPFGMPKLEMEVDKSKAKKEIDDKPSSLKVTADTAQADAKVDSLINKVTGKTFTMKVKTEPVGEQKTKTKIDSSGIGKSLKMSVKDQYINLVARVTGKEKVDELKNAEEKVKSKKVNVKANPVGKSGVENLTHSINKVKPKTVPVKAEVSGIGLVSSLRAGIAALRSKTIHIKTVRTTVGKDGFSGSSGDFINGTAHIRGTAYKSGSWGTKKSGRALGGEVGRELVVRGDKFFTIGDDGAEFFNYRKGDVIFNAAQTEEIFKNGKLRGPDTRGHAYKEGTAFISGGVSFGGNGSSGYSSSEKKKKSSNSSSSSSRSSSRGRSSSRSRSSGSRRKSTRSSNRRKNRRRRGSKSKKKKKGSKKEKEYFDWIETLLDRVERKIKRLDGTANSIYKKMGTRNKALKKEMSAVSKEITLQEKGYKRYIKAANKVGLSGKYKKLVHNGAIDIDGIKDEKLKKKLNQYKEWYEKALNCRDAIQELKEKESELTKQRFDNIVKSYDQTIKRINTFSDTIQSFVDLAETRGHQNNTRYYHAMMGFDKKEIKKLKSERKRLTDELNRDVQSGKIKLHSEAWYEMRSQIDDTTKAIVDATKDFEESANKIRQIEWDRADYNHQTMTTFAEEGSFLADLVDENEMFKDNGKLTKRGLMVQGLHTQNYNTYMRDADAYAKDIADINKKLAKDKNDKELLDRKRELVKNQQEAIKNANQEKKALQDLAKNGTEKQLKSLKELIDKYKERLQQQKDQYDYSRKMEDKSKDILSLQKQLSAYEGDTSEESKQRVQKLKNELSDAQRDLQDTQYDKYISDTKDLLDDFYSDYEESMNKKVDDVKGVLQDSIDATNANASKISSAIKSAAGEVGYNISKAMRNSWDTSTGKNGKVVDSYGKGYYKDKTSTNTALRAVQDKANNLYWNEKQDAKAQKNISDVEDQAAVPVKKTTTPPKKSGSKSSSKVSSALAKKYSFFIPKKYSGKFTKAQLKKLKKSGKGGIKSRLGLYDVDYSTSALKKYYVKMGLGKKYTGTGKQNQAMIKWLAKRGFAKGVEDLPTDQFAWTQERAPEAIIRRSDNAMLTPLKRGDSVLNRTATANIWDMANNPAEFIRDQVRIPYAQVHSGGNTIQNTIDLEITLPNVSNYQDFMNAARSDPKFEKLIQAMTTERLAGRSSKVKNSIKW